MGPSRSTSTRPPRVLLARIGLGLVALVLTGAVTTGSAAGQASAARADDAGEPILVTFPRPDVPWLLAPSSWRELQPWIEGTDTPSSTTVTVGGDGVHVEPSVVTVDTTRRAYPTFRLRAEPGLHQVTFTVEREGWQTLTQTYDVWAPGGSPIPGGDSLAGRQWAAPGAAYWSDGRRDRRQLAVWFVDEERALLGWPRHGASCADQGCVRYWYDAGSGLVQVGDAVIGSVRTAGLHLDGVLPRGDDGGDGWAAFDQPLGFWAVGRRIAGSWRWRAGDETPTGSDVATLRLRRDRHLRLRLVADGEVTVRTGRYRLGRAGALRVETSTGAIVRMTLARCLDPAGDRLGDPSQACVALGWTRLPDRGAVLEPLAR